MRQESPSGGVFLHNPPARHVFAAAVLALTSASTAAATSTYDFAQDPTISELFIGGNNDQPWQPAGGKGDGFLALTYPQDNQDALVIFPDMENGRLVKAFRFEADVRSGNSSSALPGNGFSVSFATKNDPILQDPNNRDAFAVPGAEETGSRTGLSVSLGTWGGFAMEPRIVRPSGGGGGGGRDAYRIPDEYIVVRVDNRLIHHVPFPGRNRNGECADPLSLQTGPRDAAYWDLLSGGLADARDPASWADLCWQPLAIDLDENGVLNIQWKGQTVISNLPTPYLPQAGQFILAGRTGPQVQFLSRPVPEGILFHVGVGAGTAYNEHIHLDNVHLATVAAFLPVVGPVTGTSCGISVPILDANDITPLTNTIELRFNSTNTPITTIRQGTRTIVLADMPTLLQPGSTNTVEVSFDTSNGTNVISTRRFIVPESVTIPPTEKAATFNAGTSGFTIRTHWLGNENSRGPDDPNTVENAETQLAGRFTFLNDSPIPNQASLAGATSGLFTVPLVNFEHSGTNLATIPSDNFNATEPLGAPRTNQPLPGITATDADNVTMEILTFLELPTGCHTLGVNSDDGFFVTLGHSRFGPMLGQFPAGRYAADTLFQVIVQEAGIYPIRLAWWQGFGPASVEFFSVTETGQKILINDRSVPGHIKAYSVGTTSGYLADFGIQHPNIGPNPTSDIIATFRNATTSVDLNSIRLTVDDTQVVSTVTTDGPITTATYGAPGAGFPLATTHTAELIYSIGGVPQTNEFTFTIRIGGLFMEAEHFDYDGGKFVPEVNTMPYFGDEYAGLGAVPESDYHRGNDNLAGDIYRLGEMPNVPIVTNIFDLPDLQRGDFIISENYRIVSSDTGDWCNYTRNFTNGNYFVFVAQSSNQPEGSPARQRVRLTLSGTGTNQMETVIGSYQQPSSGDAAFSVVNQVMNGPIPAVVHLGGTNTIRVSVNEGDFDWLVFVPTSDAASALNFVIEAEDFDFDGGQTLDLASVMPLATAPFAGLGAVAGIDYNLITLSTNTGTDLYRATESPNVPILENNDRDQNDRGLWIRTNNFRITAIDPGEWFNYTRTFPTGSYNIYAALSHGGNETNRASGSLQRLTTAGGTNSANQLDELGTFDAEGPTGEWGANRLVPLQASGNLVSVALGGTNTLRYTGLSGDFDYLVIVPATRSVTPPTGLRITDITRLGNQITVTWVGSGVLETSSQLGTNAVWTQVQGGSNGTGTFTIGSGTLFFRVRGTGTPTESRITSITRSGAQLTITWTGGGTLEATDQIGPAAAWTPVPGAGAGTATNPVGAGNRFFRVRN